MKEKIYEDKKSNIEIYYNTEKGEGIIEYFKNNLLYSSVYKDNPYKLSFSLCSSVFSLLNDSREILMLGTGAGCMAVQIKELIPESNIDLIDIDPEAEKLAKKYFGLGEYNSFRFVTEDAAVFIKNTEKKYDFIIIDIFIDDKIPGFITGQQFWEDLHRIIADTGIIAFNNNMRELQVFKNHKNPFLLLLQNIFHTGYKAVFHSDLHNGGWSYIFKEERELTELKKKLRDSFESSDNSYVRMAVTMAGVYLSRIWQEDIMEPYTTEDIISDYRNYVFKEMLHAVRKRGETEQTEDAIELIRLETIKELGNKLLQEKTKTHEFGKKMFRTDNTEYFKKLEAMEDKLAGKPLSEYISFIMLPDTKALKAWVPDSWIGNILYGIGKYVINEIEIENEVLEKVWKEEAVMI